MTRCRGNQYVHFKLQIPKSLSERQKQLLQEFDEEEKKKDSAKSQGFTLENAWKRLKEFLGQKEQAA